MRLDRSLAKHGAIPLLCVILAGAGAQAAESAAQADYFSASWAAVKAAPLKPFAAAKPLGIATRSLTDGSPKPASASDFFGSSWAAVSKQPLKTATLKPKSMPAVKPGSFALASATPGLPSIITRGTPSGPDDRGSGPPSGLSAYAPTEANPFLTMPAPMPRPADIGAGSPGSSAGTQVAMLGGMPGLGSDIGKLAVLTKLPAIADGPCSVAEPYKVSAVGMNGRLALSPSATLDEAMVKRLAQWEEGVQAAAQKTLGEPIKALRVAASYDCRTRNHQRGARLSEHGLANALDVSEFRTASGEKITIEAHFHDPGPKGAFLREAHAVTCNVFQTVLGPGSDGAHEDHFHMDLGRSKICR